MYVLIYFSSLVVKPFVFRTVDFNISTAIIMIAGLACFFSVTQKRHRIVPRASPSPNASEEKNLVTLYTYIYVGHQEKVSE